jgi:hypothetical protein
LIRMLQWSKNSLLIATDFIAQNTTNEESVTAQRFLTNGCWISEHGM